MRRGDNSPRTSAGRSPVRKGDESGATNAALWVPARRVELENRSAASLTPEDARWILARRAAEAIEGGRAAILRPEVRARLLATGERLGLRPFDANLILAIVQDEARSGSSRAVHQDHKLTAGAASRVSMVRPAFKDHPATVHRIWGRLAIACLCGCGLAILAIRWFQS